MSPPAPSQRPLAQVVVPADLVQRVELREVLADVGSSIVPLALASSTARFCTDVGDPPPPPLGEVAGADEVAGAAVEVAADGARAARPTLPPPAAGAEARALEHQRGVGDRPAVVEAADDGVVGTRTSVRNTSLNIARPVISRSGRISTPGWCMSSAK